MFSHVHVRTIVYSGSTAAVMQLVERSTGMRKVVFFHPGRDRPKSFKQVVTVPLSNARQQVWMSRVLGDNLINGYPVLQQVWHVKEPLLISQNLQLFTGNGNVSIEVKNSLHYFHFYSVVIGRSLRNREVQRSFFGNGATSNLPFQFT